MSIVNSVMMYEAQLTQKSLPNPRTSEILSRMDSYGKDWISSLKIRERQ